MNPIHTTYKVLSTFTALDYWEEEKITLEQGSIWEIDHIIDKGTPEEKWKFQLGNKNVYVPLSMVKTHLKSMFHEYQEQFAHLDPNSIYFGQIRPDEVNNFSVMENGQEIFYKKIDEYVDSKGKKYNAFKSTDPTKTTSDSYWEIDDIQDYENKEFVYFSPEHKIHDGYTDYFAYYHADEYGGKCFHAPVPIKVPSYFIDFPKMLDVVDYSFRNEPLTPELAQVANDYKWYKNDMEERWQVCEDIPISEVKPIIKEKVIQTERNKVMDEIDYEVEQFRQELIKKRLKP
jgi:hypothetical protein